MKKKIFEEIPARTIEKYIHCCDVCGNRIEPLTGCIREINLEYFNEYGSPIDEFNYFTEADFCYECYPQLEFRFDLERIDKQLKDMFRDECDKIIERVKEKNKSRESKLKGF